MAAGCTCFSIELTTGFFFYCGANVQVRFVQAADEKHAALAGKQLTKRGAGPTTKLSL